MKSTRFFAAGLCGLSSISIASAETAPELKPGSADSPQQLPELTVTAARSRSLTSSTVESSREQLAKVPGGAEVVDPVRYLTGRTSTLADTFALSPGVFAQSRFGSDEARLSIRGSGLQRTFHGRGIRVSQDGVPLNLADGSFDMQAIEATAVSHIDVLRGANALDRGSSTLGGTIDYITRTGLNSPGGVARFEAGSYGYMRGGIAGGFSAGSADLYAAATWQSQNGFRDHAEQENFRVFANAGWRFNEDIETRFYLTAVETDSELPGSLFKAGVENNPRQAAPLNLTLDQHRDFELLRLANKTTVRSGNTLWEFIAGVSHKDLDHPISQVIDQNTTDFIAGFTGTHESEWFGRPNRLRGGVTLTYGTIDASTYTNVAGNRGALLAHADQTATNLEAFLEDQFTITPGFTLIAGAAASANRRENDQTFGAGRDYAADYTRFSPKAGFRWDTTSTTQVYGNVSASYEPPSFSETLTLNTAREAQTGTTVELGTRGTWQSWRWDASAYHAEIRDELLTLVDPVTFLTSTINAGKTTHTGVEVGVEGDLLGTAWSEEADNRLVFRSAWTYGISGSTGIPSIGTTASPDSLLIWCAASCSGSTRMDGMRVPPSNGCR